LKENLHLVCLPHILPHGSAACSAQPHYTQEIKNGTPPQQLEQNEVPSTAQRIRKDLTNRLHSGPNPILMPLCKAKNAGEEIFGYRGGRVLV